MSTLATYRDIKNAITSKKMKVNIDVMLWKNVNPKQKY
jgi:hypothetical protein